MAGLYDRAVTDIAGRKVENEDLVNLPNWPPLSFRIAGGEWFDTGAAELLEHRLELDLHDGTLTRHLRFKDRDGRRTHVAQRRLVSMKDEHLASLETTFTAENWSGDLEVRSGLDGGVVNAGMSRYRDLNPHHLRDPEAAEVGQVTVGLQVETVQSRVRVALAGRARLLRDGQVADADRRLVSGHGLVAHALMLHLEQQQPVTVEKVVALYTSRDRAISESGLAAREAARRAPGFEELLARHSGAWGTLWNRFDIQLDSANEWTETVLHLHIFHLLQTVSPQTMHLDVGVPARGWHGEAYRGHILGRAVHLPVPQLPAADPGQGTARLPARSARRGQGRGAGGRLPGAMFPWQSGSDGREETQTVHLNPKSGRWLPDNSYLQRHVNTAIAYNVWQHYMVTGNMGFLRFVGAELLIEIARFWASLATYNADEGRYEILGVMGPDEYHEGYEQLQEFDWEGYRAQYGDIQRLDRLLEAEGDSTNRYKVSKQADVLMLLFLLSRDELCGLLGDLGYEVTFDQLSWTVAYYLGRTSHGSTLSGVMTAWVLARYQPEEAWQFLLRALESDVADVQGGTTAEGIHLGAMAGTVDVVQRCLTGMRARGRVLRFDPALPTEVKQLTFGVHYRGHRIRVELAEDQMQLRSRPGPASPIKILVRDREIELAVGGQQQIPLEQRP